MYEVEAQIDNLEDKAMKNTQSRKMIKRIKRNEDTLKNNWDNIKSNIIYFTGSFRKRRERKGQKYYLKK